MCRPCKFEWQSCPKRMSILQVNKFLLEEKNGILATYDARNDQNLYVLKDTLGSKYLLFDRFDEAATYIVEHKYECLDEVIFGTKKHRLAFDIDCKVMSKEFHDSLDIIADTDTSILDGIIREKYLRVMPKKIKVLLTTIINAIKDAIFIGYRHEIIDKNIVVMSGAFKLKDNDDEDTILDCHLGQELIGNKWSFHIVLNGLAVLSSRSSREITNTIISLLPDEFVELFDLGLYSKIHNLRLADSTKPNSPWVMKCISGVTSKHRIGNAMVTRTHEDDIILYTGNEDGVEVSNLLKADGAITTCIIDAVSAITERKYPGNKFRALASGNIMLFDRVHSSYCEFCGRDHDNDNTLIVSLACNTNSVNAYAMCRRNPKEKVLIFTSDPIKSYTTDKVIDTIISNKYYDPEPSKLLVSGFDSYLCYNESKMRNLVCPHAGTLFVHAPMKIGKTKALKTYVDSMPEHSRILFLSFRRTFTADIQSRFNDFVIYSDITGPLTQERLIVQVESLTRLQLCADYVPDLLIIDESESILEQFSSGLSRDPMACFAVFKWLMKYSRRVIIMDAYMSNRTYNVTNRLRPRGGILNVLYGSSEDTNSIITYHMHRNEVQNAKDHIYRVTHDADDWIQILYRKILKGHNVALATNSITYAKAFQRLMTSRFKELRVGIYSSETLESIKKKHFGDVNKFWAEYDLLIYTPTASAGVSFEVPYYDYMFGYFVMESCPVETCIQMMGRVRNIGRNRTYICAPLQTNDWPVRNKDIIRSLLYSRNAMKNTNGTGLDYMQFDYDMNGVAKYNQSDYFTLYVENTRMINLSKNKFMKRMIFLLGISGAKVETLVGPEEYEPGLTLVVAVKKSKAATAQEISSSKNITHEEYKLLLNKFETHSDVFRDEQLSFKKYKLAVHYGTPQENICPDFVEVYDKAEPKNAYANLCNIIDHDDWEKSVNHIREMQTHVHESLMSMETARDLTKKYTYLHHRCALDLLKLYNLSSPWDRTTIHLCDLMDNIKDNEQKFYALMGTITSTFGIKTTKISPALDQYKFVDLLNKVTNAVLMKTYGVTLVIVTRETLRLLRVHVFLRDETENIDTININRKKFKKNVSVPMVMLNEMMKKTIVDDEFADFESGE